MAIRARVELKGSLTHDGNGRHFVKGSPQILTNPADVSYYEKQAGFSVTVLEASKSKEVEDEPEENGANDYTKAELVKMKKDELIEICEELDLDTDGTVAKLIDRILDAQ